MCVVQSVACACVFCLLVCVVWFPLAMHVWLQVYSTVGLFFKWLDWFCGACHGSWSAVACAWVVIRAVLWCLWLGMIYKYLKITTW